MRNDFSDTRGRAVGGIHSGPATHWIWTLTGVALLAACAHDGTGFLDTDSGDGDAGATGGGYTNEDETHWSVLAGAFALMALGGGGVGGGGGGAGVGGGDGGGGGGIVTQPPPPPPSPTPEPNRAPEKESEEFRILDTGADDSAQHGPLQRVGGDAQAAPEANAEGGQQAQSGLRFLASDPDNDPLTYAVYTADEATESLGQVEASSRDLSREGRYKFRLEGEIGALHYNDATGEWAYLGDSYRINRLVDGERVVERFFVAAKDDEDAESDRAPLVITIFGADETMPRNGEVNWSSTTPTVGQTVTLTLTDADGVPMEREFAPVYHFFHDDDAVWSADGDYTNDGWTTIGPTLARATSATTGTIDIASAHLNKHIGVRITYIDDAGVQEDVVAYANTSPGSGVRAGNHIGSAAFNRAPTAGGEPVTVTLTDNNGIPASVSYAFWHADDEAGTMMKTAINTVARTSKADSNHAMVRAEAGLAGKYIGVDITYTDEDGHAETVSAPAVLVLPMPEPSTPPRPANIGPRIAYDHNDIYQSYHSVHYYHGPTANRTILFGEHGYHTDPRHTDQSDLVITALDVVTPKNQSAMATFSGDIPARQDGGNVITTNPFVPDWKHNSVYGQWRIDRIDNHPNLAGHEYEGALVWNFIQGSNFEQRQAVDTIGPGEFAVSSLFLQVSDGIDSDITRLSVRLTNGTPDGAIPPPNIPTGGAAPVLNTLNYKPVHLSTAIYYEGQDRDRWDKLGTRISQIRELNYGDDDDPDVSLTIVYYTQTFWLHHYTDFFNNMALLEIPRTVAGLQGVSQAQINSIPASHAWTPGDVPYLTSKTIAPSAADWTKFNLYYGDLFLKRTNDHPDRSNKDETGVIQWYYYPQGGDNRKAPQWQQVQEERTRDLEENRWGVDIVFLQVYDDEGNRSQVRTLMAPIHGVEGRVETRWSVVQTSFENWEDPFHAKYGYGDDPARDDSQPTSFSPAFPADEGGDASGDGASPTGYDIV